MKVHLFTSKNLLYLKFQKPLTPIEATNKIREIASCSSNVAITIHTEERMEERGFSMRDLLELLRNGYVDEEAQYNSETQEYKYKITRTIDTRTAAAITLIINNNRLLVITIMWSIY